MRASKRAGRINSQAEHPVETGDAPQVQDSGQKNMSAKTGTPVPNSPSHHISPNAKQDSSPRSSSLFVGSTEKAFQVLQAFNGSQRHMTLADIARTAELDRSATQRLVYTLETLGYLRRIEGTRNYGLTAKV